MTISRRPGMSRCGTALGDWLFWMDSDDTIPPHCGRGLRALAYREIPAHVLGFTMQVHCPGLWR